MKISNKLLLLAIASVVVPTSVMPKMSYQQYSDTGVGTEAATAAGASQIPLEDKIYAKQEVSKAFQQKLEAKVQQSKDFETTPDFKNQSGKAVAAHRKHRASVEKALANTKAHNTKLDNLEEQSHTLNARIDKLMTARKKQVAEDMNDISEKHGKKIEEMNKDMDTMVNETPSKVPLYNTEGRMVGGQAGL